MPLIKNLPCPKCQAPLIVVYDKDRQAKTCDCLACGFTCLLKHYSGLSKHNDQDNL